jgi:hypothetical protein
MLLRRRRRKWSLHGSIAVDIRRCSKLLMALWSCCTIICKLGDIVEVKGKKDEEIGIEENEQDENAKKSLVTSIAKPETLFDLQKGIHGALRDHTEPASVTQ